MQYKNIQMRLKLKQSNSGPKHFLLPVIRHFQPNRFTPRSKPVNHSLPKIPPSNISNQSQINKNTKLKTDADDKVSFKNKIKMIHQKKKHLITPIPFEEHSFTPNQYQQANITSNFKKEIEKNLLMIKKQKEQHKKVGVPEKTRYNTPRHATIQSDSVSHIPNKFHRCITQQDNVFVKLNQIIIKSQSKSTNLLQQPRLISYSSYISNHKIKQQFDHPTSMAGLINKVFKTEGSNNQKSMFEGDKNTESDLKNQRNYHQWRKLSIESNDSSKIYYNISSFDIETDRLEKIRSKNELSLKKYIQGKNYLRKLNNFRDSSELLPHPERD